MTGNVVKIVLLSLMSLLVACKTTRVSKVEEPVPQKQALLGGYTEYRELSDDERRLFETTYTDRRALTPVRVASCIVAGVNYRFVCVDKRGREVVVTIAQPLPGRGNPYVKKIE